ncbi:MAG: sulfur reduction protein DsrS [Gammaproteobacteria bacterium]|nr:sulfur reduction protein DsrS [Gammaproteobacteria bacterium]
MELSAEDALRLNVLLANEPHAVRIDESAMALYGFSARGESKIKLNPTCRDEAYIKRVREMLSSHVLGSPGGYPIYLRRWTRMGQARDDSLEKLLLLGEPEAVVAVVHATGLTDELARRAWWAMPTADNARMMLTRECVTRGAMGPVLAHYLIDYLPFEEDPQAMIESVRLILQPGLIDAETRLRIWTKARSKNTYFVGFLLAIPDDLPDPAPIHPAGPELIGALQSLTAIGNPYARQLCRVLDVPGQSFLATAELVLRKPNNQDVMVALLEAIQAYFQDVADGDMRLQSIDDVEAQARARCESVACGDAPLAELLAQVPDVKPMLRAMLILSAVGERLVAPVFARTDAIGTVMRRKLEPITTPLLAEMAVLRGSSR